MIEAKANDQIRRPDNMKPRYWEGAVMFALVDENET